MKKILYIHGLGGGANSRTPRILKEHLDRKEYEVVNPELPVDPRKGFLQAVFEVLTYKPDLVIASSLGGFYALRINGPWKTLVINPAMGSDDDIKVFGLGTYEFNSTRADGLKSFEIDEDFLKKLDDLRTSHIENQDPERVYGIFGTKDELFSHIEDFRRDYKEENMKILPGEKHSLSEEAIINEVIPLVKELLK